MNYEKAMKLIEEGASINHTDVYGKTPVRRICEAALTTDSIDVLDVLLTMDMTLCETEIFRSLLIDTDLEHPDTSQNASVISSIDDHIIMNKFLSVACKYENMALKDDILNACSTTGDDIFVRLCMCRAGFDEAEFLEELITGAFVELPTSINALHIVSLVNPFIFDSHTMSSSLSSAMADNAEFQLFLDNRIRVPPLKIQTVYSIRKCITSCSTLSWFHKMKALGAILPSSLIADLSMDEAFNGTWQARNFTSSYQHVMGFSHIDWLDDVAF